MRSLKKSSLNRNLAKPQATVYYGTAGYRLSSSDLNNVICRASLIAYIRSATFAGKFIGLYITASHNPLEYNGVKFIDFNGNMLDESWESASDELVNSDEQDFNAIINKIFRQNSNYSNMNDSIKGNIIVGRDTRASGIQLTENIKEVLGAYRCNVFDYGEVSCPEMHFLIRKCNEKNKMVEKSDYVDHLFGCFLKLRDLTGTDYGFGIDTANGVGRLKMEEIAARDPSFTAEILNPENGVLNKECGADYIKVNKVIPKLKKTNYNLCASFDGDVDRLILYTPESRIFDGDAQSVFIAELIKSRMEAEELYANIGVVLSHYSNMGAVDYLKNHGFTVSLAQTGVKNFVREARKYDVGLYFEPNGHGSVTFSKRFLEKVDSLGKDGILKILTEMFDPCVGDALANFLVFKSTLRSIDDLGKYKENYTRLMTVKIKDKNALKVDQNNSILEPDIQKKINEQVLLFKGSRAFVRPSGTEDLVRIFAECPTESHCDKLALNVAQIVYDNCDGVGPHPEISYHK